MKSVLLTIFIIGLAIRATSQINYTDIPNIVLTSENSKSRKTANLDINGDGINDVQIFALDTNVTVLGQTASVTLVSAEFFGTNELIGEHSQPTGLDLLKATALSSGNTISNTSDFINATTSTGTQMYPGAVLASDAGIYGTSGYFADATNKYIGIKFDIDGASHYGWILVDVIGDGEQITIKSVAYEETPNKAITIVNKIEEELNNSSIYFSQNHLNILGIKGSYNIIIYNLLGTIVLNDTLNDESYLDSNRFSSGIFLVQLTIDGNTILRKVGRVF